MAEIKRRRTLKNLAWGVAFFVVFALCCFVWAELSKA